MCPGAHCPSGNAFACCLPHAGELYRSPWATLTPLCLAGVDMCVERDHGCQHSCVSTPGSFYCECNPGYQLNADRKTCSLIDYCSFGNHSCQHECVSIPSGHRCRCHRGFTLQPDGSSCRGESRGMHTGAGVPCSHRGNPGPKQCPAGPFSPRRVPAGCGAGHVDLVMVIDGSKSVRPQNFELVKQFVNRIVDLLEVSPQGTRVGLVQYFHTTARTEIKEAVMKVEYMEKGTMTGLALKHMVEHSFSELEGARPLSHNVPRIGLVFTDGRSQDDISEWARRAKESGIVMFAVGVGKAVEEELRAIASEPVEQHFSYSADFTTMTHLVENFKLNICPGGCPPPCSSPIIASITYKACGSLAGAGRAPKLSPRAAETPWCSSYWETEIRSPCECEALVQFQTNTVAILQSLTERNILWVLRGRAGAQSSPAALGGCIQTPAGGGTGAGSRDGRWGRVGQACAGQ
uniref:Matrilin 4 n=1 Tax=Anas platyrhynchos TaxID=8839 RepID=A0A8B9ZFV2_ANAPL